MENLENKCPFCTIARDQIILERPLALVKRDGYPLTKGHSLIIPRRHVAPLSPDRHPGRTFVPRVRRLCGMLPVAR